MVGARILVVDDEEKIVSMVREFLEKEHFTVDTAKDGAEALHKLASFRPELIVLDVMMPEKSGTEVLAEIRRTDDVPVILLTAKAEELDKLLGLELGADDYITKPFSLRELSARIKVVLRRTGVKFQQQGQAVTYGTLTIDVDGREVLRDGEPVNLTPTEFGIMETLARSPGRVFTRLQLMDALGEPYLGYERSLDTHISNLRRKLEVEAAHPRYIITVYGIGYKFGGTKK